MSAPSAIELALDASGTTTNRCNVLLAHGYVSLPFDLVTWGAVTECRSERPEISILQNS
jgi:hypothetical protein